MHPGLAVSRQRQSILFVGAALFLLAFPISAETHKDWDVTSYFNTPDGTTALSAFQQRRYDEAGQLFDVLAREPIPPETEQPARYMAAVSVFYAGDFTGAARRFRQLRKTYPLLETYHSFFEAEANRKSGNIELAVRLYQGIPASDANGERAKRKLMLLSHEQEQHQLFVETATEYKKHHALSAELTFMLAAAHEGLQNWSKAAEALRDIQVKWPATNHEIKALKRLEKLQITKKKRTKLKRLTEAEVWRRAEKLFSSHRSKEAAAEFARLSKEFKKGSEERCSALHHTARSWDKLRKRKKSAPWHAKAIEECPKSDIYPKILYFSGKSAFQLGEHERALREFASLHQKFPKVSFNDDAWIWEAHIHRSENRPKQRKAVLERSLREMPDGDMREQVEWLLIWDLYREKNWNGVVQAVDKALQAHPRAKHHYAEGRRLYWKARALEKLNNQRDANAIYGAIQELYPFSFYSVLSLQRLEKNLGASSAEATVRILETKGKLLPFGLPGISTDVNSSASLLRGLELLRMGLPSPALREFERSGFGKTASEAWQLSALLADAGLFHKSYEVTRRYRGNYAKNFPAGSVRNLWDLAYPRPYKKDMERFAADAGIPPEFGWAIMRTESAFKADAESWANAIGLMQLLVPTAKDLVRKGEPEANANSLKVPIVNMRLGTRFLGQLYERFNHIALSSAGYNAGPGALGRWLRARKHMPFDEFVEEIPFREARRYVKSVSSALAVYHFLNRGEFLRIPLSIP